MTTSETPTSDALDVPIARLDGSPSTLREIVGPNAALVVNVASQCGLTPQYEALERLQEKLRRRGADRGRRPVQPVRRAGARHERGDRHLLLHDLRRDLPADREGRGQRPGAAPALPGLVETPDEKGRTGDIAWNFEKFLLDRSGRLVARFSPPTTPDDPRVIAAIEGVLAGS